MPTNKLILTNSDGDIPICNGCDGSFDQLADCAIRTQAMENFNIYPDTMSKRINALRIT